jgi:hypothetical protein
MEIVAKTEWAIKVFSSNIDAGLKIGGRDPNYLIAKSANSKKGIREFVRCPFDLSDFYVLYFHGATSCKHEPF